MKKYIVLIFSFVIVLLGVSCSSDEIDEGVYHCQLELHSGVPSFVSISTRASVDWMDGDVIYLYTTNFYGFYGYAVYSSSIKKWNAYFSGIPVTTSSGTIVVRYLDGVSQTSSSLSLSSSRAVFADSKANYSYSSANGMVLTANLKPALGRIRFKGTSGMNIKVNGLKYYQYYNRSSDTFSWASGDISLVVNSTGYTDYVYGDFADATRMLTLVCGSKTFTTYCSSTMLASGSTGYITVPTEQSHTGWTMEGENQFDTDVNISLDDSFGSDECYDESNDQSADISVGEFSGDECWDPLISQSANITLEGFDSDEEWDVHHDFVDLGLSVKWATCNVGADKPEDYGDYYAWGETETKDTYDWSTYKWCSNGSWTGMTKYTCPDNQTDGIWYNNSTFVGDNKTTLDPEDDVAHVKWGGTWRMPTEAEQDELLNTNNCIWNWTTQDGVNGYKVTSKKNGNSIFLPASGYRYNSSLNNAGSYGYYWSCSLYVSVSSRAYNLGFDSSNVGWVSNDRFFRFAVRPVCP